MNALKTDEANDLFVKELEKYHSAKVVLKYSENTDRLFKENW